MSNSDTAAETLQAECDAAIADIRERAGTAKCDAHAAVARGLIVLLRCQRATLGKSIYTRQLVVSSLVGAVIGTVCTWLATHL